LRADRAWLPNAYSSDAGWVTAFVW